MSPTLSELGAELMAGAGALRAVPLPYPYKKAHFKLDFGGGQYRLAWLSESQCQRCLDAWGRLPLPRVEEIADMARLCAHTAATQAALAGADGWRFTPETLRLVRLCLGDKKTCAELYEALAIMAALAGRGLYPGARYACALKIINTLS